MYLKILQIPIIGSIIPPLYVPCHSRGRVGIGRQA
jgi:hypothetical protein